MKILLVEDDEETADYVSDGLKREGHVIDRAANGRDGLFLAAAQPYDVTTWKARVEGNPVHLTG